MSLRPRTSLRTQVMSVWSRFRKTPLGQLTLPLFSWNNIFTTLGVGLISVGSFLLIWDQIQLDTSTTDPPPATTEEGIEIPPGASEETFPPLPILDLNQGTAVNTELAGQAKLPAPSTGFRLPNNWLDQAQTLGDVLSELERIARTAGAQQTYSFRLRRTVEPRAQIQQRQQPGNATGIGIAPPGVALTTNPIDLAAQAQTNKVDLDLPQGNRIFISLVYVVVMEDTYQTEPTPDLQPSFFLQYNEQERGNFLSSAGIYNQAFNDAYVIDCLLYQFVEQNGQLRWTPLNTIGFPQILQALGIADQVTAGPATLY